MANNAVSEAISELFINGHKIEIVGGVKLALGVGGKSIVTSLEGVMLVGYDTTNMLDMITFKALNKGSTRSICMELAMLAPRSLQDEAQRSKEFYADLKFYSSVSSSTLRISNLMYNKDTFEIPSIGEEPTIEMEVVGRADRDNIAAIFTR